MCKIENKTKSYPNLVRLWALAGHIWALTRHRAQGQCLSSNLGISTFQIFNVWNVWPHSAVAASGCADYAAPLKKFNGTFSKSICDLFSSQRNILFKENILKMKLKKWRLLHGHGDSPGHGVLSFFPQGLLFWCLENELQNENNKKQKHQRKECEWKQNKNKNQSKSLRVLHDDWQIWHWSFTFFHTF